MKHRLCALACAGAAATVMHPAAAASNAFNPDTSVSILSLFQNNSGAEQNLNGFSLQEVELQFAADIDPYWRASALLSVSQEDQPTAKDPYPEFSIDPEEVYAETLQLPVTLRIGKFKTAIGKHNTLHTHAFPFVDAPLIHQALLGDEGWNDVGVSAAALVPHFPWFSELTVQVLSGHSDTLFNSSTKDDVAFAGHFKNLFDLSDSLTMELGLSDGYGSNAVETHTNIFGADLTFKFRPVEGGKYSSFQWATEYLSSNRFLQTDETSGMTANAGGIDGLGTWVLYQFAERWTAGARYDIVGVAKMKDTREQRESLELAYIPTEFSGFRLQYGHKHGNIKENSIALQMNLAMGAHPAHGY